MYNYITDISQLKSFTEILLGKQNQYFGIDVETTGLDPFIDTMLLLQIDICGTQFIFDARKLGEKSLTYICELIEDNSRIYNNTLIGHNIKFDLKFIKQKTGCLFNNVFDLFLAEVISENGIADERYPSLEFICAKYLGKELDKEIRKKFYDPTWDGIVTEQMVLYSAEDVAYLGELRYKLQSIIDEQKQGEVLKLENKLVPVVAMMELEGVLLDKEAWLTITAENVIKQAELEKELKETFITDTLKKYKFSNAYDACSALKIFGAKKLSKILTESLKSISGEFIKSYLLDNINISSHAQLLNILQNVYEIPIKDTNEKTINKFEDKFPIIKKIIEYREHSKKVTGFGERFTKNIHPITGRLHVNMNQLGCQSGRFSTSPNTSNIPRENLYRNCFIPRPGYKILAKDYSQEELRLMADISTEANMINAYKKDIDLHAVTAALVFGIPVEEVTKNQRFVGKSLNFAVGYGSTEFGLFKNFGIPLDVGKEYLNSFYNKAYSTLRDWKKLFGKAILKHGYSKTLLGRKRFFRKPKLFRDAKEALTFDDRVQRELINHQIQGTGAEIIKESMVRLFYENPFGNKFILIMQVYDEIVAEVHETISEEADQFMTKIMLEVEQKYLKHVPAKIDGKVEDKWSK